LRDKEKTMPDLLRPEVFVQQATPGQSADGNWWGQRGDRTGIPFTADWKRALLLEGRVFQMTVGTLTGGGDISMITGGGAGTIIDQDQPEFGVSVPLNTTLIPLEIHIACQPDLDADGEEANIVITYDSAAAYAGDGTVTSETPVNMITGGGVNTNATAFSAATADITDPTVSGILAFKTVQASEFVSNGTATNLTNGVVGSVELHYEPSFPIHITGPGAFYGYWGGTAAVPGLASVIWGEVPSTRINIS